jgi:muramidase (phage lysozyme)
MSKQTIKLASAFSLICSIGFTNAVHAEPSSNNRPLSENCKQAWATADSTQITVPKILCREEDAYNEAFDRFLRETATSSSNESSTSAQTRLPKFPKYSNTERHHSTEPKKRPKSKTHKVHGWGKSHSRAHHKAHGKSFATQKGKIRRQKRPRVGPTVRAIAIPDIHPGTELSHLSAAERKELRRVLESLLQHKVVIAFLNAVQWGEGGGPLVVVGGLRSKSPDCQRQIHGLNFSAHPKEQGLPNRCFLTTKQHGLSTAAGSWQIVYYRNWRTLRRLLNLKDFSERSQAIAALELVRSSQARGGKVGEGLIALIKGDLDNAIRKGTDPWASSPYSRWHGKRTAALLRYARQELRRLGNQQYVGRELKRFGQDTNA